MNLPKLKNNFINCKRRKKYINSVIKTKENNRMIFIREKAEKCFKP